MTLKNKISLILLALIIFMGCKNKSNTPDIDKALSEVTTKFPQLPKGGIDHYLLEKSVKNLKFNFEIQLYSEVDSINNDSQKILVFINTHKECYAIPLFSNTYRDYWEFKREIPLPKIKKVQSTFTKQYLEALIILKLNKIEVCRSVTNEMLISLLNCKKITNCDFLKLKNEVYVNRNESLEPERNHDYLEEKRRKDNGEILNTKNSEVDDDYRLEEILGYLDRKNYRFYQIIFGVNKNPRGIITTEKELQIKSYRKDLIINRVSL